MRYGKQVWEIGYPDRTGDKFFKGDGANYWLWGWNLRYALLFPNDITYTIGKSDYHKDWFFEEVPHATNLSLRQSRSQGSRRTNVLAGSRRVAHPISADQYAWTLGHLRQGRATPGPSNSTWIRPPVDPGGFARRARRR